MVNINVEMKGHGRFGVCVRPNIKVTVSKEDSVGTIFTDLGRKFNLGFVCKAVESGQGMPAEAITKVLAKEPTDNVYSSQAAMEWFSFQVVEQMVTAHFKTRLGMATILDSSEGNDKVPEVKQNIFFVEKPSQFLERIGIDESQLEERADEELLKNTSLHNFERLVPVEIASLSMAQSLVQNRDWAIFGIGTAEHSFMRHNIANGFVARVSESLHLPGGFDFDSAQANPLFFQTTLPKNPDFLPTKSGNASFIAADIAQGRDQLGTNSFPKALARASKLKDQFLKILKSNATGLDAKTLSFLNSYVSDIDAAVSSMSSLRLSQTEDTDVFADAALKKKLCNIGRGTPLHIIEGTKTGQSIQVGMVDRNSFGDNEVCLTEEGDSVHRGFVSLNKIAEIPEQPAIQFLDRVCPGQKATESCFKSGGGLGCWNRCVVESQ